MIEITLVTLLGQVVLPIALLTWVWRGSCCSRSEWLVKTVGLGAYLGLMTLAGIALLIPWYATYGTAALALPASVSAWRRIGRGDPDGAARDRPLRMGSAVLLTMTCLIGLAWAAAGLFPPPGPSASVAWPLLSGEYYIVNGGYSILINPHMKALSRSKLHAYRGQGYAIDIVKLNRFGLRAQGVWPRELSRYEIFGEAVVSPCDGQVLRVENRLPDHVPPACDRENPAGNFVYLECGEAAILLAHLMQASIRVSPGERVSRGQPLGRVGNSGYSTEPHLHLHAQQKRPEPEFLSADPWVIIAGGRHLVRNSRVRIPAP